MSQDYQDYPVFKGLQRPLEFLGMQGRYIYWAAATVGGAIIFFVAGYLCSGFVVGLAIATAILGGGGSYTFIKKRKGLHSKKAEKGIFIFSRTTRK